MAMRLPLRTHERFEMIAEYGSERVRGGKYLSPDDLRAVAGVVRLEL